MNRTIGMGKTVVNAVIINFFSLGIFILLATLSLVFYSIGDIASIRRNVHGTNIDTVTIQWQYQLNRQFYVYF